MLCLSKQGVCSSLINRSILSSALSLLLHSLLTFQRTRESASVYTDYLRSCFLSPSQKSCVAEPQATYPRSDGPRALKSLNPVFAFPFLPLNFSKLSQTSSRPVPLAPDKVAYPMLEYLSRFGMAFLLHIFHLSCSLHTFPFIRQTSIIPHQKMSKTFDSSAPLWPITLTSCVSKFFERVMLLHFFCLVSNFFLSPSQAGFRATRSTLHKILFLF